MAFVTFIANLITLKNPQRYKKPYSAVISDIWYCRIDYIGLLKLHMLDKKYLKVQFQGKKMS